MDLGVIEQRLGDGERLKIKYRYPKDTVSMGGQTQYGVRSDKLVDVSTDLRRLYANFRGVTPIWLEADEVIEITPDDGIYEDGHEGQ